MDIVASYCKSLNREHCFRRNRQNTKCCTTSTNVFWNCYQESRFVVVTMHPFIFQIELWILLVKRKGDELKIQRTLIEVFPVDDISLWKALLWIKRIQQTDIRNLNSHIDGHRKRWPILLNETSNDVNSCRLHKSQFCFGFRVVNIMLIQRHSTWWNLIKSPHIIRITSFSGKWERKLLIVFKNSFTLLVQACSTSRLSIYCCAYLDNKSQPNELPPSPTSIFPLSYLHHASSASLRRKVQQNADHSSSYASSQK